MVNNLLNSNKFCEKLGISKRTLNRLIKANKVNPFVVKNNRLYFIEEQIPKYLGLTTVTEIDKRVIAYCRVSTSSQKIELENQRKSIETFAINSGIIIDDYFSDVGSGINFNRPNFLKILQLVFNRKVSKVIITYKDRLARFAFDLLENIFGQFDCELIVINLESTSPQAELIEDLMTVIHVFSSRLYGLRRYKTKTKIKELIE